MNNNINVPLKSPLVSICIPVYNGAEYVHDCINSVILQTYQNIEIVICDNASTDCTYSIIKKFSDKRIKYYRNYKNIGSINNFNLCINNSTGTYILLLPHDDLLFPNTVKTYVENLKKSKKNCFFFLP